MPDAERGQPPESSSGSESRAGWRKPQSKVVLVEEDDSVAGMVCYFLELQAIKCLHAVTAEAAWRLVGAEEPDMVIIDLRLRAQDGGWLMERLRDEKGSRIPLLIITDGQDKGIGEVASRLSCACLSKPFSYAELNAKLDAAAALTADLEP